MRCALKGQHRLSAQSLSTKAKRFPIPTVEETLIEMNGSKVFSKIDLNMGFHQLELDEESRPITIFATHIGLYRYKRLMFGVTSAPEIYQYSRFYMTVQAVRA
jgi:hypothetical protein